MKNILVWIYSRNAHGAKAARHDFKPMAIIGKAVEQIRVKDEDGIFRVMYTARFEEALYVLHAFQRKTEKTSTHDVELARPGSSS